MFDISLKSSDLSRLIKNGLGLSGSLQAPLRKFGYYQINSTRQNFIRQRSPDGTPWTPLKQSTIEKKGHALMLRDSYAMYRDFSLQIYRNRITIINNRPYAKYHQNGTEKIPKREFMGFSDRNIQTFKRYVKEHIAMQLSK